VDALANHFKSVFNTGYQLLLLLIRKPQTFYPLLLSPLLKGAGLLSALDLKCIGLSGILWFIIKSCVDVFTVLLTHILIFSVSSVTLLSLWKQTAVVSALKNVTALVLRIIDTFLF
jgi:hypothetical protein